MLIVPEAHAKICFLRVLHHAQCEFHLQALRISVQHSVVIVLMNLMMNAIDPFCNFKNYCGLIQISFVDTDIVERRQALVC